MSSSSGKTDTTRWLRPWDGRARSFWFDLGVAVLVLGTGVSRTNTVTGCALAAALPALLLRRRYPWAALAAALVLSFTQAGAVADMVAVYTAARQWGLCARLWIAAPVLAVLVMPGYYQRLAGSPDPYVYVVVAPILAVGSAGLLGLWVHGRRALLASLRDRADQAERERDLLAERAVETERRRIAREMHDVVAHRVSVIALQAGGLSVSAPDERTAETAEVIRRTGATALAELRAMLRVLRDQQAPAAGAGASAGAAPEAGGIPALVDEAAASGADVRAELPDPLPEMASETGRAAYRVVQESLTNAAKHAPHAAVHVALEAVDERLRITVANRPGRPAEGAAAVPGSGYGLIGMRERVTLAGGTLHAGATDDGGYRVRAELPLRSDETDEVAA